MEFHIDLDKKHHSYRDAFQRYYERKKNIGLYFEFGYPKVTQDEAGYLRLHEVRCERVCARATDVAFVDNKIVVKIEPFGPMKDLLSEISKNEISIGARMAKSIINPSIIREIASLDIVSTYDYPEFLTEVTVK